jgi:hypothetical protein
MPRVEDRMAEGPGADGCAGVMVAPMTSAAAEGGSAPVTVTWEDDAPPLVRVLGASLRRAVVRPEVAARVQAMSGRVALCSTVAPQAATIHFDQGAVRITHGRHAEADVVIRGDLDTMGRPGAPKPKVSGALRHPRFALAVAKVLDSPSADAWPAAVDELWRWGAGQTGRPDRLRVVCSDDGLVHELGTLGGSSIEVHGPAWALLGVFTGADHVGAALLEGRVKVVGDFPVLTQFVGLLARFMMGEPEGAG